MENSRVFSIIITVILTFAVLIAITIGANIIKTKWTKELIQSSLERGQNPMYVKCAMEGEQSSNECKTLITSLAVTRSDK